MGEITTTDEGDRWHLVLELDGGRKVEVWVPKKADRVDLVTFTDYLLTHWAQICGREIDDPRLLRDMVGATEKNTSGVFFVDLECGHRIATRERRVAYPCGGCAQHPAEKS